MGFAENFIQGYTHGVNAKRAKEQGALAREQFEEHKAEAAQRFKLDSDEAKARRDQQTLNEKLALINIQKMTPAALPDTSHVGPGGVGPPEEKDFPAPPPSIGLDVAGQHIDVPGTDLEATQRNELEQVRAKANIADEVKGVKITHNIPDLGLKAGDTVDPAELVALAHVFAGTQSVKAAGVRAAAEKPKTVTLLDAAGRRTMYQLFSDGTKREVGPAPLNATTENRVDTAVPLIRQGNDMISKVLDPELSAKLGPVLGRYNNLREFVGNPPPEFADFAGELKGFALANMTVHGMRNAQAAEKIEQFLSGKHTPESIAAGIHGILSFSHDYVQNAVPGLDKDPTKEAEDYLAGFGKKQ